MNWGESMNYAIGEILKDFTKRIEEYFGESLIKVLLYGSYARGDNKENSDIDIMILTTLSDKEITEIENDIYDIAYDFLMDYGVDISVIIKNEDIFKYWLGTLPFYNNVEKEDCVEGNHYKDSINRSYYAAFYAIKAVLALSEIDFKRHKDVIAHFNKNYVAQGEFNREIGKRIARLQQKREKSDYDDFYIASKDEAFEQIETAEMIINAVEVYLTSKNKSDSI